MVKTQVLISAAIICLLSAGCLEKQIDKPQEPAKSFNGSNNERIDTPAGMIEYLNQQHLPAIEFVEPWQSWLSEGLKITTAHYEIYTTVFDPLLLRDIPFFLESCNSSYQNLLPVHIENETKFEVYLFSNRTQWEIHTIIFAGRQAPKYTKIKAGAYYHNGCCIAYDIGRERTFRALGHECWHQFADRIFKFRLPSWLNEGIAMQFEANRFEKGIFHFQPEQNLFRLGSLKKTFISDQMIGLEELVSTSPGQAIEGSSDMVSAYYSQSYALIRFLQEAGGGKYSESFRKMLEDGLYGRWKLTDENTLIATDRKIPLTIGWNEAVGLELFGQYIEIKIGKIEQEYMDFCEQIVYNVILEPILTEQYSSRQLESVEE